MSIANTEIGHWDVRTHNGKITIRNPATGQHRTFRVRTQPDDAVFMPGCRVVALLAGPDNIIDYVGFGFVEPNRGVIVWMKKRGQGSEISAWEKYARLLNDPEKYQQAFQLEYMVESKCRVCNRPLTNPESIQAGIGPVCREEY